MPSAFPDRHVVKGDPLYERVVRHQFVLQPPLRGASARDFIQYAQDLSFGFEAKTLTDSDSIPRSSYGSQGLTLQALKKDVADIVSRSPIEWIRGCVGLSLLHHPEKRRKLVSVLSRLPDSTRAGQKLLSVPHGGKVFALNVQRHENRFIPDDGLYIWLDNPSDPVAENLVQSDRGDLLTIRELYESKQKMEYFDMNSLLSKLLATTNLTESDLKPRHEPLGIAFPDFELNVCGRKWAVEVTRIEEGMVSYLRMSEPLEKGTFEKAARSRVTDSRITAALTKAFDEKTKKRNDCPTYSRACLLLVDVVDSVDDGSSDIWSDFDLSAFDVVALVELNGSVCFIKGDNAL